MRLRNLIIAGMLLAIAGCSSKQDVVYSSLSESAHHPPPGLAQLVFYYPYSVFWINTKANVEINGQMVCGLKTGTFAIRNINPANQTEIAVSLCSTNGTGHLKIHPLPDHKYYIRIVPNDSSLSSIWARRNLSDLRNFWNAQDISKSTTSQTQIQSSNLQPQPQSPSAQKKTIFGSVFWLNIVSEPNALQEMQDLKICPDCL